MTDVIRANTTKKASLSDFKEMEKKPKGIYEVVMDFNIDIAVVLWKGNKAITVASTYCVAAPLVKPSDTVALIAIELPASSGKSLQHGQ